MNAVTETEIEAITAAPAASPVPALQVADPTRNLILATLSHLLPRRSKRNARTTPRQSIPELAASIERVGLLQNLIVVLAADGEHYEVVARDRRLTALRLLAKKKRISAEHEVVCLLVADASARTVSLAENLLREQMHPADQFDAFANLVKEGRPVEDIAADFGVSPLVVQRRLKLANVSPRLLADYRADVVTIEQLMALAISDDHAAQEAAFYDAPEWQRGPSTLRERLTGREIDAAQPLVQFVGLEAYVAAGGGLRRDLFAEGDVGTYVMDTALLNSLVSTKLEVLAEEVRSWGWAWVDAVPRLSAADQQRFQRAPQRRREPRAREARRIASLQARVAKLDAELQRCYAAKDDDAGSSGADGSDGRSDAAEHTAAVRLETLEQRREQVVAELKSIEATLHDHAPEVRAIAGAVVTVDRGGAVVVHRGVLREADAEALRAMQRSRRGNAESAGREGSQEDRPGGESHGADGQRVASAEGADSVEGVSARLALRLSAHRTAALQIEVARHPQVALAAVVHRMVQAVLQPGYAEGLPVGVRAIPQNRLELSAPDFADSRAAAALHALQQAAGEALPQDDAELFEVLLAKPQDELVALLAVCVAQTIDVVTERAETQGERRGAVLARAAGLEMAAWWQPTAEGYFQHIPKAAILAAVGEFAPSHVERLSKLKKGEIAREAERLVEGTGWMPAVFWTASGAKAGGSQGGVTADPVVVADPRSNRVKTDSLGARCRGCCLKGGISGSRPMPRFKALIFLASKWPISAARAEHYNPWTCTASVSLPYFLEVVMKSSQRGDVTLMLSVVVFFGALLWTIYDWMRAEPQDVQAVVTLAESNQQAKAALAASLAQVPNPDRTELRRMRSVVNEILVTDIARAATGDRSLQTPSMIAETQARTDAERRDALTSKTWWQMDHRERIAFLVHTPITALILIGLSAAVLGWRVMQRASQS